MLADLGEIDARHLFVPAGFPSLLAFCVAELGLFDQAAKKRIRVARAARRFPVILPAIAEGRLHLSAVVMLAPYPTGENADALLSAAECRTRAEVEALIAERFPGNEMLALVEPLPGPAGASAPAVSPGTLAPVSPGTPNEMGSETRTAPKPAVCPSTVKALAPERYALHLSIGQGLYEKIRRAQDLLSHQIPSGDLAEIVERAVDELIAQLEKRKLAATSRPRPQRRSSTDPRSVPDPVTRAVWERDQGRCTFIGATGHRCESRRFLELDHIVPVARGGQATVDNLRLHCSLHNAYQAERAFGASFMEEKKRAAEQARAHGAWQGDQDVAHARADAQRFHGAGATEGTSAQHAHAIIEEHTNDVFCGLRNLGFRAEQARRGAEFAAQLPPETTLEERLRAALKVLCPRARAHPPTATSR